MKSYPVSVPRTYYRGSNPQKLRKMHNYNRVAARVESYINADLERRPDDSINRYMSDLVALELCESPDLVRDIILRIDCGHNGVTIVKGDYDRAMKKLSAPPDASTATS